MPVEQSHPHEIGVVTGVSGEAYAQTSSGTRVLEPGSPIYQGEELVTGGNGNVEVRFVDDTLISQGANSRIALDDYVYDPDGGDSSFLGDIAEGTFRTVTGKIAEQNPDRFKLGSPLATIGIRGTIILSEVSSDGEKHGVEEIHAGKAMLLQSKATGAIRQLFSGQMVDVGKSGILSPVRTLSAQERDNFRKIASENIRQEQEIREQQDDDQQDDQIDEQNDEQQNDDQQQDGPKEELPGDVDPGGGDPGEAPGSDGGVLHPGQGVLDPGDDALVGQQKFNPEKIDQPPEPFEKPEVEEQEENEGQQEQQQEEGEDDSSGDTDGEGTEEGNNGNQQKQQDDNEADDANTGEDDTGDTENDGTDDDAEDNPHDIHGSGSFEGTVDADTLTGSSSDDTIQGLGGNDTLYGEAGDDELFGGTGNDTIYGGAGEDMLNGGAGNNYLDGGSGETHEIDFASFIEQEHGVTVDLSDKNDDGEVTVITDDDENTQDVLVNIEGVIGTNYADTLVGDEGVNRFNPLINESYNSSNMESIDGGDGSDWIQFENIDYSVDITLHHTDSTYAELKEGSTVKSKIELSSIENVQGSSQADKITGSDEANTLLGGEGNDSISGGIGDDSIDGGTGNDFISGGEGANIIDGGEGTDSLSYDYITAGSDFGIDITLSASGTGTAKMVGASDPEDTFTSIEKFFGSGTHDTFTGSDAADTFDGNDGDDRIYGNGGDDVLAGGAGSDEIYGGAGADSISGGSGNDKIYGEADNDSLSGGAGDDTIYGGAGDDFIQGGTGNNELRGGTEGTSLGNDTLSYQGFDSVKILVGDSTADHTLSDDTGSDTISDFATYIGSDGADSFIGGSGKDTFIGGKGNDTFKGAADTNFFDGGEGTDTVSFADSSTSVTVSVQETGNTTVNHSEGKDIFSSVESFIGSALNDYFMGSANNETFSGGDGNDNIYTGDGNDTLIGGAGTNRLDGQGGTKDFVSFANASSGITVTLDGANEVTVGTGIGTDIITNIEGIIGSAHNDDLTGDGEANYFKTGLNSKYLSDGIYESVTGGGGSDWVQFDDLSNQYYVVAEMNNNHVYVKSTSDNSVVNKVILSSIENVLGSSGNDIMTGSSIANTLDGAAGDDSISGGDGADILYGGIGNDSLAGGKGDNTLDGGEGYDRIEYSTSTSGVTFNINASNGSATHSDGTDQFNNIEIYQGSDHEDIFNGSANSETFIGGKGNDSITGGDGVDTIDYRDQSVAVTIVADTGSGNGSAVREVSGTTETDIFKGIENFIGSSCDDSFTGSDASETFEGGSGTDNIDGGGGTDFISFAGLGTGITIDLSNNAEGSGNLCTVTLGGGNDTFKNIEGVIGSSYSDSITASSSGASTVQGGDGADTINLVNGKATQILYASLSEGGDTINSFQNHDSDATNSDKFCFSGSDFDSSATLYSFDDGYTDSASIGTTSAYFVFDDDNRLWYDSNGDSAGGATMIAQIASGDDVTADDISFA